MFCLFSNQSELCSTLIQNFFNKSIMMRKAYYKIAKLRHPMDIRENDIRADLQCSIIKSLRRKPEVLAQYHQTLKCFPKGIVKTFILAIPIFLSINYNVGNDFHISILRALNFLKETSEYSEKLRKDIIKMKLFGTLKTRLINIRILHPQLTDSEDLKTILEEIELILKIVANILRRSGPQGEKLMKKCDLFSEVEIWSYFNNSTIQYLACLVLFYSFSHWQENLIFL